MPYKSRGDLAQEMHDLLIGQKTEDAMFATSDVLWNGIAFLFHESGADLSQALAFVDTIAADMKAAIETNWGEIETQTFN